MTIGEPIRATRVGLEFKKHLLGIAKNPIKLFVGIKLTDSWPIFFFIFVFQDNSELLSTKYS